MIGLQPPGQARELACLNFIFNNAIRNGKAERNPVRGVERPPENNKRDMVLTAEEYAWLLACCAPHIKPIVQVAYHTGMRRGEILKLR